MEYASDEHMPFLKIGHLIKSVIPAQAGIHPFLLGRGEDQYFFLPYVGMHPFLLGSEDKHVGKRSLRNQLFTT